MDSTPSPTAPTPSASSTPPAVTDRRPSPRGVLPRGVQTWLLAGLAAFMLLIMFVGVRSDAPARPAPAVAPAAPPTADRVRDYQERLRALEALSLSPAGQPAAPPVDPRLYSEPQTPPPADPIEVEKKRR